MDELVDLLLNTTCEVLKGGICHILEGTSFSPEQGTMTVHLYQCSEVVSLRFFGDSGGQEDDLGVVVEHVLSACDLWDGSKNFRPLDEDLAPPGPQLLMFPFRTEPSAHSRTAGQQD